MQFNVSVAEHSDGSKHVYLNGIEGWDDFDLILSLLQKENDCKVLRNDAVVYMRQAELERNGVKFLLNHDDMLGNYFYTKKSEMVPTLRLLAQNVVDSIKEKLKAKGLL